MPQFGLLFICILLPLEMLAGGSTPRESMPELVQNIILAAPSTRFVMLGQAILFRGAGPDVVWPQFLASRRSARPCSPRPLPQHHRHHGLTAASRAYPAR